MTSDDDYEPTSHLRLARPARTTTKPDRLQQLWRKPRYAAALWRHQDGWDTEWRDVPVEIVKEKSP